MSDVDVVAVLIAKPGSGTIVGAALHHLVAPTRAESGRFVSESTGTRD